MPRSTMVAPFIAMRDMSFKLVQPSVLKRNQTIICGKSSEKVVWRVYRFRNSTLHVLQNQSVAHLLTLLLSSSAHPSSPTSSILWALQAAPVRIMSCIMMTIKLTILYCCCKTQGGPDFYIRYEEDNYSVHAVSPFLLFPQYAR